MEGEMVNETEPERLEREFVEAGGDLPLLEARLRMTVKERSEANERAVAVARARGQPAGKRRVSTREEDRLELLELELIRAKLKGP